jgi:uncharacterized membrane protein YcaP (DUF421 family)
MFDLDLPWWEFIARGAIVYCFLLAMVRITGKRTIGQFTPFDLLIVMLLSEAVSNSLTGGDQSLTGGLIIASTLIALNVAIAVATSRSRRIADLVDGRPVLLGRDGKIFDDVVKSCRVAEGDVEQALREADCPVHKMKCAFLEPDGKITILQNEQ